ncbi:MAG: hypothetical protein AAGJ29_10960, partial [Pseudomonadota bacterium]
MFRSKAARIAALEAAVRDATGIGDWLEAVRVTDEGRVTLIIRADPGDLAASEDRRVGAESAARVVKGVTSAHALLTSERPPERPSVAVPTVQSQPRRVRKGARLSDEALNQGQPASSNALAPIAGISRILAVASA